MAQGARDADAGEYTRAVDLALDSHDQVAISLLGNSEAEVAIHGHTDNVGGAKYNQDLSLRRAESVKAYLVSLGIPAARMSSRGYGFVKPIADNATAQGRAKNRRIEFVRIK